MQSHSPPMQPSTRHCVEILRSIVSDTPRTWIHPMHSGPQQSSIPLSPTALEDSLTPSMAKARENTSTPRWGTLSSTQHVV